MAKPPVRRIETATGHYYVDERDNPIPGVTTILKALPKDALVQWQIKKAVTAAMAGEKGMTGKPTGVDPVLWLMAAGDRESFKAADVGTNAHEFAELHMLGQEPILEDLGKKEQKHANCYLQYVRDHEPQPVLVEKVLTYIDPKTGQPLYCGTMDLVARHNDGYIWLVDYKASASRARPSHALQASAYRYATHWVDTDTGELHEMPEVHRAAVILLNGGGEGKCYRMFELDTSPVVFSVFKSLLRIHNFCKVEERVILGQI